MIKEGWALVKYRWADLGRHVIYQGVRVELLRNNHNVSKEEVVASGLELEEAEAILKLLPNEQRRVLITQRDIT